MASLGFSLLICLSRFTVLFNSGGRTATTSVTWELSRIKRIRQEDLLQQRQLELSLLNMAALSRIYQVNVYRDARVLTTRIIQDQRTLMVAGKEDQLQR